MHEHRLGRAEGTVEKGGTAARHLNSVNEGLYAKPNGRFYIIHRNQMPLWRCAVNKPESISLVSVITP